ncbi:endonuclease/exonuclease/phosphatase family protein [Actinocorallia herbida]|uniref:endonuclease/exonuclease/phosphatase family protein n=1 Tax=Actinocorallia herbida TaxID=58109 RepID=UPI0011CDB295|nr:endonuclease/exonuclease/phosphatase family protein [Actinocorallia herbida]
MSFTPYVAGVSVGVPVVALVLRRWKAAAVGLVTALVLVAGVVPRVVGDGEPVAGGPEVRALSVNTLHGRTRPGRILELVRELRPDVLSVQELWTEDRAELDRLGLQEVLPHRLDGTNGTSLFSRYPVVSPGPSPGGSVRGEVTVPGFAEPVEVVAVHTCAPVHPGKAECWRASQATVPAATPDGRIRILVGDFNATFDHATFRRVLDTGYRSASAALGDGLEATWHARAHPLPGIVIDHVLADRRVAVLGYATRALPGSDHRAVYARLRLP